MKKLLLTISTAFLVFGVTAQVAPTTPYVYYSTAYGHYSNNKGGLPNLVGNGWHLDNTFTTNWTDSGGSGGFVRGTAPTRVFHLNHDISGRIVQSVVQCHGFRRSAYYGHC